MDIIRDAQASAQVEDWRVGVIRDYVQKHKDKNKVCLMELWIDALYPGDKNARSKYNDQAARQLGEIVVEQLGWKRGDVSWFGDGIGSQKAFLRPQEAADDAVEELLYHPPDEPANREITGKKAPSQDDERGADEDA